MYIGFIYYRINQYLFATSYLEQAENGFRRINYIRKSLNCKQVLGAIYSELREYDKAEQILKEALDKSTYPTSTGIILRVLGLNMFAQKRYNDAADYFKKSLEINEYSQSIFGMRSQTDLSHSLFKLGEYDLAISSFKKAKAGAEYYKEVEFNARCKFIEGLYIKNNTDIVDSAIRELNRASLFFEVCELSEELIEFYKEKDDNTNIIKYLNIAYEGKKNQSILGDDQV